VNKIEEQLEKKGCLGHLPGGTLRVLDNISYTVIKKAISKHNIPEALTGLITCWRAKIEPS